jgi:NhaP-type Na+/H+ or K+/H+ antiporter
MLGLVVPGSREPNRRSLRGLASVASARFAYLMYAINHGLPAELAETGATTLAIVVVSIVLHGVSVTPLMSFYERLHDIAIADRTADSRRSEVAAQGCD